MHGDLSPQVKMGFAEGLKVLAPIEVKVMDHNRTPMAAFHSAPIGRNRSCSFIIDPLFFKYNIFFMKFVGFSSVIQIIEGNPSIIFPKSGVYN